MNHLPTINIDTLQPSLATAETIANSIISAVIEGQINPLDLAVKKKCIEEALSIALKDPNVKSLLIEEVQKHGKKASHLGAEVSITNKTTYQYTHDATWLAIAKEMEPLQEKLKAQEEKIKAACKNNASLIDQESGEIIASIVPSPSVESVAVSFKKPKATV